MVVSQARSKRKTTGGRYKKLLTKRSFRLAGNTVLPKLGETKVRQKRTIGGSSRNMVITSNKVNVFDPKTKKFGVFDIELVVENPASRHFVRRNILTKGTIIQTKSGKARITSRPGQDGTVNAVLV